MRGVYLLPLVGLACSASFDPKDGGGTGTTRDLPGGGYSGSGSAEDGGSGEDGGAGEDGGSGSTGGSSGSDSGGEGSIADLDDLKEDMNTTADGCEAIDGNPLPGAASYFYGELEPESSESAPQWIGSEEWLLFANEAWRDAGADDCRVTWVLRGEEAEPGACTTCELTLALVATLDEARTSCPESIWSESRSFSVTYDIQLDADTRGSQWFFAESGTPIGTGSYSGLALNYLSSRTCVWF